MSRFSEAEVKAYEKIKKYYEIENFKNVFESMKDQGDIPNDIYEEDINWSKVYDDYYDGVEMNDTKRATMENSINKYMSMCIYTK